MKPNLSFRKAMEDFHRRGGVPVDVKIDVILSFFESLDCSKSLMCAILYRYHEFDQLVSLEISPSDYNDRISFRDSLAAVSFLKKCEFLCTTFDRKSLALAKFRESEIKCASTNQRLKNLSFDPSFRGSNVWLHNATIRKIEQILGDVTLEEILDSGAFGPGATTCVKGKSTSAERKFQQERHVTMALYQLFGPGLEVAYPIWYRDGHLSSLEFQEFSKVITVPKNAKIDRTIAVEPGINIWFQKAMGKIIRRRLRRAGLDLDSAEKNVDLARYASRTGLLSTIDFSGASDSISIETVSSLLPERWFRILDCCRTRHYKLGSEVLPFRKFSSMGNGFTFELETLIFYASALASCEYRNLGTVQVSVFGDDVVLPVLAEPFFVQYSEFLGFTVNSSKSSSSTYFRESCGSYWWNGEDCKPFFFKKDPVCLKSTFSLVNSLRLLAHRRNFYSGCDLKLKGAYYTLLSALPSQLQSVKGTVEGGSGCIWSNFDEAHPRRLRDGWEGYSFLYVQFKAVALKTDSPAINVARLHARSLDRPLYNSVPLRGVVKPTLSIGSVSQWYNYGPWY